MTKRRAAPSPIKLAGAVLVNQGLVVRHEFLHVRQVLALAVQVSNLELFQPLPQLEVLHEYTLIDIRRYKLGPKVKRDDSKCTSKTKLCFLIDKPCFQIQLWVHREVRHVAKSTLLRLVEL